MKKWHVIAVLAAVVVFAKKDEIMMAIAEWRAEPSSTKEGFTEGEDMNVAMPRDGQSAVGGDERGAVSYSAPWDS